MSTDISVELAELTAAVVTLSAKLVPGSTFIPAQAPQFGQRAVAIRDLARLCLARTPLVPIDPEPRPTYDPTTHQEIDNPEQFEDVNES